MIDSDEEARMHMVKEYVGNAKKFYDHLENRESCRKKWLKLCNMFTLHNALLEI